MFKIDPTFKIQKIDKNTGNRTYRKTYGSIFGFGLTLVVVWIAVSYIGDKVTKMLAGHLDKFTSKEYPFNFDN